MTVKQHRIKDIPYHARQLLRRRPELGTAREWGEALGVTREAMRHLEQSEGVRLLRVGYAGGREQRRADSQARVENLREQLELAAGIHHRVRLQPNHIKQDRIHRRVIRFGSAADEHPADHLERWCLEQASRPWGIYDPELLAEYEELNEAAA